MFQTATNSPTGESFIWNATSNCNTSEIQNIEVIQKLADIYTTMAHTPGSAASEHKDDSEDYITLDVKGFLGLVIYSKLADLYPQYTSDCEENVDTSNSSKQFQQKSNSETDSSTLNSLIELLKDRVEKWSNAVVLLEGVDIFNKVNRIIDNSKMGEVISHELVSIVIENKLDELQ